MMLDIDSSTTQKILVIMFLIHYFQRFPDFSRLNGNQSYKSMVVFFKQPVCDRVARFFFSNILKRGNLPQDIKIYLPNGRKNNGHKRYTNIFYFKARQNIPELVFLLCKYTRIMKNILCAFEAAWLFRVLNCSLLDPSLRKPDSDKFSKIFFQLSHNQT
jgi:hypothetical protein